MINEGPIAYRLPSRYFGYFGVLASDMLWVGNIPITIIFEKKIVKQGIIRTSLGLFFYS